MMKPAQVVDRQIWRHNGLDSGGRTIPEETAVGAIGATVMVSVSAPTALAVRMAHAAGITLAAIARADGFEVFTHPCRILFGTVAGAADQQCFG